MEHSVNKELVDSLLSWSRERLEKKDYPKGPLQLGPGRVIPDCGFYISCIVQTLEKQGENPTFTPVVEDYCHFRQLVEGQQ